MTDELRSRNFYFGIITDGKRPAKLRATLDSIYAQNIELDDFDVMVSGDTLRARQRINMEHTFCVCAKAAADEGRLGAMRNRIIEKLDEYHRGASGIVIICDDDMLFAPDFCQQIRDYEGSWDVMCPRIENPDGSRYWDWATCGGAKGHVLLDYVQEPDEHWYNTGGLFVGHVDVFKRVRWPNKTPINNTDNGGYNEDRIFSASLRSAGLTVCANNKAVVCHDDGRLSSKGRNHIYAL